MLFGCFWQQTLLPQHRLLLQVTAARPLSMMPCSSNLVLLLRATVVALLHKATSDLAMDSVMFHTSVVAWLRKATAVHAWSIALFLVIPQTCFVFQD
jgi:hypothetical protein